MSLRTRSAANFPRPSLAGGRGGRAILGVVVACVLALGTVLVAPPAFADDDQASITGTVVDANGPVVGASVTAYDSTGNAAGDVGTTDADGHYDITSLPAGSYTVQAVPGDDDDDLSLWLGGTVDSCNATTVTVNADQVVSEPSLTLPLASDGATISGTITDVNGPVANAVVAVIGACGVDDGGGTTTDDSGDYTVTGLVPGTYTLDVQPADNDVEQWLGDAASQSDASSLTLTAGDSATENFTLVVGGTVNGVVEGSTGQPLNGASVSVFDSAGDDLGDDTTDSSGAYSIDQLPAGSYTVEAQDPSAGYASEWLGQASAQTGATYLSVTAGSSATASVIKLTSSGSVAGTVTDTNGPVVGAAVTVLDGSGNPVGQSGVVTGSDGTYSVGGILAGSYTVQVQPVGNDVSGSSSTSIVVGESSTLNFTLAVGGTISGIVENSAGAVLSGASVSAFDSNGTAVGSSPVTTNASGQYSIDQLPAGSYTVEAQDPTAGYAAEWLGQAAAQTGATYLSVTAGSSASASAIKLTNSGSVAGTVTDAHGAVAGASVTVLDASGNPVGQSGVVTGSDGTYSVGGIPAGSYVVEVQPAGNDLDQYSGDASTLAAATTVAVTVGHATTENFTLVVGATINGVVENTAGSALPGASVSVYDSSGDDLGDATTGSGGSYSINQLPAGSYTVEAQDPSAGYAAEWLGQQSAQAGATYLSVTAGSSASASTIQLTSSGSIAGTVSDAHGAVAGASVTVLDASGNPVGQSGVVTGSDGTYSVGGIPAGSYAVEVQPAGNDLDQYSGDASTLAAATTVAVTVGHATTENFTLVVGATINGVIETTAGAALQGASVSVFDSAGDDLGDDTTDSAGAYSIDGLPAGSYTVEAQDPTAGFAPAWLGQASSQAGAGYLAVTTGSSATASVIKLTTSGLVTGTVTDAHGPVVGASVTVLDSSGDPIGQSGVVTGSDGTYSVNGVPAGSYTVQVQPAGNDVPLTTVTISVTVGQATTKDITLVVGGIVSGIVQNSAGAVLQGASVSIFDSTGDDVGDGTTDSNGQYSIDQLPTGSYTVEAQDPTANYAAEWLGQASTQDDATYVSVTAASTTGAPVIKLSVGGSISGTVTDANGLVVGASVTVLDSSGNPAGETDSVTNSLGVYTVNGIPAGSYTVQVQPAGNDVPLTTATIVVTVGHMTTKNITLAVGATINGVIETTAGAALQGASVSVFDSAGDDLGDDTTDSAGAYSIDGLPAGSYTVEAQDPTAGFAPAWLGQASAQGGATYVSVAAATATRVSEIKLSAGGTVSGTLTDANGPVAGTSVMVSDSAGDDLGDAVTDDDGDYTIQGVPAGSWSLGVTLASGTIEYLGGAFDPSTAAESIAVSADQTTTENVALVLPSGKVTDLHHAVSDADVSMVIDNQGDLEYLATTDGSGAWTSGEDVLPGTSTFQVDTYQDGVHQDAEQFSGVAVSGTGSVNFLLNLLYPSAPAPVIVGTAAAGHALTAVASVWTPKTTFGYQWYLNGTAIAGATKTKLVVQAGTAAGAKITVKISGAVHGYQQTTSTSTAFLVGKAFAKAPVPKLTGVLAPGQKLTAVPGVWAPAVKLSYQWFIGGAPVPGATGASYTVPKATPLKSAVSVAVRGAKAGYATTETVSASSHVLAAFTTTSTPKIKGKAAVGSTLTVTVGKWAPKPSRFAYQWFEGKTAIRGAKHATLKLAKAQLGTKISVQVTVTKSGSATYVETSASTAAVKKK